MITDCIKYSIYGFLFVFLLGISACKKEDSGSENQEIVVTKIKVKGENASQRLGKNILPIEGSGVKDCFIGLSENYLPIPSLYRLQMLDNYEIRDIFRQKLKMEGETDSSTYDFEIDNLDSLRGYMMFSVFKENKEMNYFLRYFSDTTENPSSVVGISQIIKRDGLKSGKCFFLSVVDSLIVPEDSLFPNISLRDFIEEKNLERLNLAPELINSPPLLVWMPYKGDKVGIDLNIDALGEKKSLVKAACRRTHLEVTWLRGEGVFAKENMKPYVRKFKNVSKRKSPKRTKPKSHKRR